MLCIAVLDDVRSVAADCADRSRLRERVEVVVADRLAGFDVAAFPGGEPVRVIAPARPAPGTG